MTSSPTNPLRGGGWKTVSESANIHPQRPPPKPIDQPPLPPAIPRRRLYSRSDDLELAVPLSVEIWNFVVPSRGAAACSDDESDEETTLPEAPASSSFAVPASDATTAATTAATTTTTTWRRTTRWYRLFQHRISILEEVEMQMVVQEERRLAHASDRQPKISNGESDSPCVGTETQINGAVDETHDSRSYTSDLIANECKDEGEDLTFKTEDIVLYQSMNDNGLTANPCWFHLQEKLSGNTEWINLHRDTYESLEFRFSVVDTKQQDDNGKSVSALYFLKVPGHPSQLVSLGNNNNNTLTNLKASTNLPINTVVVHYSDHTSRILPTHYELLVKHQPQIFPRGSEDKSISLSKWSSSTSHHHPSHHHQQQSSLVPRWRHEHETARKGASTGVENRYGGLPLTRKQRFRDDAFKALDDVKSTCLELEEENGEADSNQRQLETPTTKETHSCDNLDGLLPSCSQTLAHDLLCQRQMLLQCMEQELKAYQQEKQELEELQVNIRDNLHAEWKQFEEQTRQIRDATQEERSEIQKLDLLIEMHRIRLVRGLEACYPVVSPSPKPTTTTNTTTTPTASTMSSYLISGGSSSTSTANSSNNNPTLRGWTLPSPGSLFTSATDEELSAVLGALSHVVLLLAKYLGVPLRYRIFSNSSRSAIQDDCGIIHPLFLARPVEREQVAQGLVLLERNVICIAESRGISIQQKQEEQQQQSRDEQASSVQSEVHIFEKVRQLYQATIKGPIH